MGADAVVSHEAGARVTFWPHIRLTQVRVAACSRTARRERYELSQRTIPAELIVTREGIRCTSPALTALDLTDGQLAAKCEQPRWRSLLDRFPEVGPIAGHGSTTVVDPHRRNTPAPARRPALFE